MVTKKTIDLCMVTQLWLSLMMNNLITLHEKSL